MKEIFSALELDPSFELFNKAHFHSCFAVSELAAVAMASVGCALSTLAQSLGLASIRPQVRVNKALASLWFGQSIQPIDWSMPPVWDAIAGDYRTQDGWIKLHTNLAHHRQAALEVIACKAEREQVAQAVANWRGIELESAVVAAGGVAAALRSREQWRAHEQGAAVASEPLVAWNQARQGQIRDWQGTREAPLRGLKVLDLTRVLAGPVSTRTLAGFGAQVLRIDPPSWDEPNVVPDITLGKRCASLNLQQAKDRKVFEGLLRGADVLVHGYRADALADLGYDQARRLELAPNLIEVSLDAYGWSGPWSVRRGFDSLVQMSCGIAHQGMLWSGHDRPTPLPVQALDHATGYLMAAAVICALNKAIDSNRLMNACLSLARTAELLMDYPQSERGSLEVEPEPQHYSTQIENTFWGSARRLKPALQIEAMPMHWGLPASELGSELPVWS